MAPRYLIRDGQEQWEEIRAVLTRARFPSRSVEDNLSDLHAAVAACQKGIAGIRKLCGEFGASVVQQGMRDLMQYSELKIRRRIKALGDGERESIEHLDDGTPIQVRITIKGDRLTLDFNGTGNVHPGNLNATPAIVNSAVVYVMRLLVDEPLPLNDGLLAPVTLILSTCLLNPQFDSDPEKCPAVVGGNVETSQRLVDTLLKPFGIIACSQGTMNNLLFGDDNFGFYETICGGTGAGDGFHGASAVHHHMTNTRITDPEIMEFRYPVRVRQFAIRKNSGGKGRYSGGDGVIREIEFLRPLQVSLLTQHRVQRPYGMSGGEEGAFGEQFLIPFGKKSGNAERLPEIGSFRVNRGDRLHILTPGGGGFGRGP